MQVTQISTFTLENTKLRVFGNAITPLFPVSDICRALGISNPSVAVKALAPFERSKLVIDGRELNVVNESGLYTLILRSRDAVTEGTPAYCFRLKVTAEILPAIRKTGQYQASPEYITTEEQYQIRKAIKARAKNSAVHYQTVYNALYDYFKISSYKDLRHDQMKAALALIETCTLKPQLPEPELPAGAVVLEEDMVRRIVTFIYNWRYLFRDELKLFLQLLYRVQSPLAPMLWEAVNDLHLSFMEDALAKKGFSVKDLDSYKSWASHQPKA